MCAVTKLKTCLIIAFFSLFNCSSGSRVHWSSDCANLTGLRPAGKEGTVVLYTCRSNVGQDLIVGKLWPVPNTIGVPVPSCNMAYKGKYQYNPKFELLRDSSETTSWVPFCGSAVYGGALNIIGGQVNRRLVYVCRAVAEGWLIPGYFDMESKRCIIEIHAKAHAIKEDFEMLVVNKYGIIENSNICMNV